MNADSGQLAELLLGAWEGRLERPIEGPALRKLAVSVADALVEPDWIRLALAVAKDGSTVNAFQEVRQLWLEVWPRTMIRVAAMSPERLLSELSAAAIRVDVAVAVRSPADRPEYLEMVKELGSPPVSLRHELDVREDETDRMLITREMEFATAQLRISALVRHLRKRGDAVLKRATRRVIGVLQRLPAETMRGGKTGLSTLWEEICVQVQYQESAFWDTYLDMLEPQSLEYLTNLPDDDLEALWLMTSAGEDWLDGEGLRRNGGDGEAFIPVLAEECVQLVKEAVLDRAANWTNARVRLHLAQAQGWIG